MTRTLLPALLGLLLLPSVANAAPKTLIDFADKAGPRWRAINDRVMGGRSQGAPTINEGIMTFAGTISLENNGGFSSCRTVKQRMNLKGFKGLVIRIKPDARKYRLTIESDKARTFYQLQFWAELKVKPGQWQTLHIPFKDFYPTSFGRRLRRPTLDPSAVDSIGFMLYDKKAGPFKLQCDSISAYKTQALSNTSKDSSKDTHKDAHKDSHSDDHSIVGVAKRAGAFETLLAAANAAGLAEALQGKGPFTIFAPTDEAFAKIPAGQIKALLKPENRATLQAILKFHVVAGKVQLSDIADGRLFKTLNGQRLAVSLRHGHVKLGRSSIVSADIQASNGIIHVIDSVLLPETRKLVAVATQAKQFKTLLAAAKAAGLASALNKDDANLTIFAPTDAAFAKLPKGLVQALLKPENKSSLVQLLTHHVVSGRVYAADAIKAGRAKSLAKSTLKFGLSASRLQVNGSTIQVTNLNSANGVIHVIDSVLIPKGFQLASGAKKRKRLILNDSLQGFVAATIERGVPLFNNGETEACRAVYENAVLAILQLRSGKLSESMKTSLKQAWARKPKEDARSHAWRLRKALDAVWEAASKSATTLH